ncbi:hypothetical protein DND132_1631 [Pseudodesulfovibrio mercurii]|uniref:Uncharacterized protein n=1 Tax=Pseudodesulfovibrio mercurii TaxID=641491 RepID=F0JF37_9BACT|nr:hypothetical protein [Pseudodesulfovibrio mercurii]EGB14838.1 hypothetical protein DND132_1631 [Pseudodesulfovibrio mercurii]
MIDLGAALPTALSRLKTLPDGAVLTLLTFKRDRGVAVRRVDDGFEVREFGYRDETVLEDADGLRKRLKGALKREFPRSNKVHLLVDDGEEARPR